MSPRTEIFSSCASVACEHSSRGGGTAGAVDISLGDSDTGVARLIVSSITGVNGGGIGVVEGVGNKSGWNSTSLSSGIPISTLTDETVTRGGVDLQALGISAQYI